ncbi:MAG: hypothetical protein RIQ55_425 [Pseudomonadota bacterium]
MFTYYLNSLHEFREKNLEFGQASTRAWLELVAHFIDGQYLVGRAVLHPAAHHGEHGPGAHWERVATNDHHELAMKWVDDVVAKTTKAQEIIFAAVAHNATGWSEFSQEFLHKLEHDASPEYAEVLKLIEQAMQGIASTESAAMKSARDLVKAIPRPVAKKSVTKRPSAKAVSRVPGKNSKAGKAS